MPELMRERILETATSMFVERGYDGVAMREISDACGITKAALYHHFAGKADLPTAVPSPPYSLKRIAQTHRPIGKHRPDTDHGKRLNGVARMPLRSL